MWSFYDEIELANSQTKSQEVKIILDHANLWEKEVDDEVNDHGLGIGNWRWEKLIMRAKVSVKLIGNTWFKQQKRRL